MCFEPHFGGSCRDGLKGSVSSGFSQVSKIVVGFQHNMSVSDNSTLDVSHDNDGLGGYAYGAGDLAVSPEEVS